MTPKFSVEQSYRVNGGNDYQHHITSMFNMEPAPSVIHPITDETMTPDAMLTLWNRSVIFEITRSAEKLKTRSIEVTSKLFKQKYPNCLFVVILGRIKTPRDVDGLDSTYDALTKLVDYVLVGEDEVNEFINSPKQPIKNYKLKPQTQMTTKPNQLNTETSVKLMMSNGYSLETINQFMSFAYGAPIKVVVKDKTSSKKQKQITPVLETLDPMAQEQQVVPTGWVGVHTLFNKKSTHGLKELGMVTFEKWTQQYNPRFVKVRNNRGWSYYTNVIVR